MSPSPARTPWIFLIFWLLCCGLCLGLSAWQWQRLAWKTDLLREIDHKKQHLLPVSHLTDHPSCAFYRVKLRGSFDHTQEVFLQSRTQNGIAGQHVITPFRLVDGRTVIVNRGWIARQNPPPWERPSGLLTLEGYLMPAPKPTFWTPLNRPEKGTWYWLDLAQLAPQGFHHLYVVAIHEHAQRSPLHPPLLVTLPNNHLGYALTWLGLACALFITGFLRLRRKD